MKKTPLFVFLALLTVVPALGALLDPLEPDPGNYDSTTLNASYEELIRAFYLNGNTTRLVGGNLSVPWFSGDNVCGVANLQSGGNCNIGTPGLSTSYCMVTDEFSQVGVVLSMGANQTKFEQFYKTVRVINSTRGVIPAWRVLVNETAGTFSPCDSRTNSNCDTASDATARIIFALYSAANNTLFTNTTQRAAYHSLANTMLRDMVTYEITNTCYNSTQGYGPVCWWPAGGSEAKTAGITSSAYMYSGYHGDIIIALLQGCKATGNTTYCLVAANVTLSYLQAAMYDNATFRVSPGKNFKWTVSGTAPLAANCTDTCTPDQWDSADAPRAHNLGLALYLANLSDQERYVPKLRGYMQLWNTKSLGNVFNSAPIQFWSNGTASAANASGYKGQGFQGQGLIGLAVDSGSLTKFNNTLRSALGHFDATPDTWDYAACFGIYGQAFSMTTLGVAIGRADASFNYSEAPVPPTPESPTGAGSDYDLTTAEASLFLLMGVIAAFGTFVISGDLSITSIVAVTIFVIILGTIL